MGKSESNFSKQLASITPDTVVTLFEIDFSNIQADFEALKDMYQINIGAEAVYRFCAMINGTNPVVWQGREYQPLPIQADDFESSSDGKLPRPKLRISNPEGLFSKIVHSNKDFANCKVTRKRTFVRFLDDVNFQNRNLNNEGLNPFGKSDPNAHFRDEVYFISKKITENKTEISFELVSALELEDSFVPARVVLSNYCNWTYRCDIGCRYTGAPIENSSGKNLCLTETGDPVSFILRYYKINGETGNIDDETTIRWDSSDLLSEENIPEWTSDVNANEKFGYQKNDIVKIISKHDSLDPHKRSAQVFVCLKDHQSSRLHNPFFDQKHWAKDECNKTLDACKKRFGRKDERLLPFNRAEKGVDALNFGGFPGTEAYPIE